MNLKKQTKSKDFEVIPAKEHDKYKDFKMDNCYVLIKVNKDKDISVAVCNLNHEILKEFKGKNGEDLCKTIFNYAEKNNLNWFKRLDHAAYLGRELKKAEIALSTGKEYEQE